MVRAWGPIDTFTTTTILLCLCFSYFVISELTATSKPTDMHIYLLVRIRGTYKKLRVLFLSEYFDNSGYRSKTCISYLSHHQTWWQWCNHIHFSTSDRLMEGCEKVRVKKLCEGKALSTTFSNIYIYTIPLIKIIAKQLRYYRIVLSLAKYEVLLLLLSHYNCLLYIHIHMTCLQNKMCVAFPFRQRQKMHLLQSTFFPDLLLWISSVVWACQVLHKHTVNKLQIFPFDICYYVCI